MYSYGRKSGRRRVGIGAAAVAGVTLLAFTIVPVVGGATSVGAAPRAIAPFQLVWSQSVNGQNGNPNDGGLPIAVSSPNLADLQGAPAVVVGDRAGYVYALSLASGRTVPGWPASTGGATVGKPVVARAGTTWPSISRPGSLYPDQPATSPSWRRLAKAWGGIPFSDMRA